MTAEQTEADQFPYPELIGWNGYRQARSLDDLTSLFDETKVGVHGSIGEFVAINYGGQAPPVSGAKPSLSEYFQKHGPARVAFKGFKMVIG